MKILKKIKTAYRRIDLPIKRGNLVIDIGSGGTPNPLADICVDGMDENLERDTALKIDRPFVWANVQNLPFEKDCFDYSILSHVLEHLENPAECLTEINRISKAPRDCELMS